MIRLLLAALVASIVSTVTPASAGAAPRCTMLRPGTGSMTVAQSGAVTMHVPAAFTDAAPAPLVLLLHGSTATGAAMLRDAALGATADRHGFLVAAPDGGIRAGDGFVWNIPGVPTVTGAIPTARDRDDVAYLTGLVAALVEAGCADPTRVYVTGLSGGGRMSSWLGCVVPERFAAIAPVVGLRAGNPAASDSGTDSAMPDPDTCRPKTSIAVVAFAGDKDTTNPIQGGGAPYWQYTMHTAEQRWAALNGCTGAPATRWIAPGVYEERYDGCRDGTAVVGRVTVGGGHSWKVVDNEALWTLLSRFRRDPVTR